MFFVARDNIRRGDPQASAKYFQKAADAGYWKLLVMLRKGNLKLRIRNSDLVVTSIEVFSSSRASNHAEKS